MYVTDKKAKAAAASRAYYARNKEKQLAKHKEWVAVNKDKIREHQRERKRERKLQAVEYLGGHCIRCLQEHHPAVYEFHHRDPNDKDRDPSKMLQLSWKRLEAELNKCDLLCANCHRLVHHQDRY